MARGTAVAAVMVLVGLAGEARGEAPPVENPPACDASGRWKIAGAAGAAPLELRILRDEQGFYEARRTGAATPRLLSVADRRGVCAVELEHARYHATYSLVERDGAVTGTVEVCPPRPDGDPVCTQAAVEGKKSPLAAGEAEREREGARFLDWARDRCELPGLAGKTTGSLLAVVTVAAGGAITALVVEGADQLIADNCDGIVLTNEQGFFGGTPRKAATITFQYDLGPR